jgi:hypothetical protein
VLEAKECLNLWRDLLEDEPGLIDVPNSKCAALGSHDWTLAGRVILYILLALAAVVLFAIAMCHLGI